eukprot:1159504-Pelagomonas_calceolata.AAC.5
MPQHNALLIDAWAPPCRASAPPHTHGSSCPFSSEPFPIDPSSSDPSSFDPPHKCPALCLPPPLTADSRCCFSTPLMALQAAADAPPRTACKACAESGTCLSLHVLRQAAGPAWCVYV